MLALTGVAPDRVGPACLLLLDVAQRTGDDACATANPWPCGAPLRALERIPGAIGSTGHLRPRTATTPRDLRASQDAAKAAAGDIGICTDGLLDVRRRS